MLQLPEKGRAPLACAGQPQTSKTRKEDGGRVMPKSTSATGLVIVRVGGSVGEDQGGREGLQEACTVSKLEWSMED